MSSASTAEKLLRDIVRKIAHYLLFIAAGIKQVKETRKRLERKERALESEMCPICADVLKYIFVWSFQSFHQIIQHCLGLNALLLFMLHFLDCF